MATTCSLRTERKPRVFDALPETNLSDLLPPEEARPSLESLSFEVTDARNVGVDTRDKVNAPRSSPSGMLASSERRAVNDIERSDRVTLELSELQLPLLDDEHEHDGPTDRDAPARSDTDATDGLPSPLRTSVPGPKTMAQTELSLVVEDGKIEAVDLPAVVGEEPSPVEGSPLTFSALVLSLPDEQNS